MRPCEVRKWGVDLGNVIVKNLPREARNILQEKLSGVDAGRLVDGSAEFVELDLVLRAHAELVDGSLYGVRELVRRAGSDGVWIVSRCSGLERVVNARLLSIFDVYAATGLRHDHVHFVDEWSDKAGVCARLGIQGHIDDRGVVLFALKDVVPCLVWFNPKRDDMALWYHQLPGTLQIVLSWDELCSRIDMK